MTVKRTTEIFIEHSEYAHTHRLGSFPAWTKSPTDISDELLSGHCYVVEGNDEAPAAFASFIPMAREMSGVWYLDTLVPLTASESYWASLLADAVAAHIKTALTARVVQRFSVDQTARSRAAQNGGWVCEGVLDGYYRLRGVPINAEQWALTQGSAS